MEQHPIASILGRVVPAIFGCIGVTVLIFLWSSDAPLFFRLVGSFIASMFCLIGFGGAFFGVGNLNARDIARIRRGPLASPLVEDDGIDGERQPGPRLGYECPNCGSSLDRNADVSPSGDAKCTYCDRWFNIHQAP